MGIPEYKHEERCIHICKGTGKRCRYPRVTENLCVMHLKIRGKKIQWNQKEENQITKETE